MSFPTKWYLQPVKLLTEHHLQFLSLTGGCTGSSESTLVEMHHCWKSHRGSTIFWDINYLTYFYDFHYRLYFKDFHHILYFLELTVYSVSKISGLHISLCR